MDREDKFEVKSGEGNNGTKRTYRRMDCVKNWYRIRLGNPANLWHVFLFKPIHTRRTVQTSK